MFEFSLRAPVPEDLDDVFRLHSDPRTYEHWPESVLREPWQAQQLLDELIAGWERHGVSYWVISDTAANQMVGMGGLRVKSRDGNAHYNLYYRLFPEFWGNGIATEVAKRAIAVGHDLRPEYPVVARTRGNNIPAQRTARAAGLSRAGNDSQGRLVFADRPLYPSVIEQLA